MVFGMFCPFQGTLCFYAFHSVLSLVRVDINFVPFKGIFYTNNCPF